MAGTTEQYAIVWGVSCSSIYYIGQFDRNIWELNKIHVIYNCLSSWL